jgi:hypothetical protein
MPAFICTFTAVTFLVLLAYSVEQLANTYSLEMSKRQAKLDALDALVPNY